MCHPFHSGLHLFVCLSIFIFQSSSQPKKCSFFFYNSDFQRLQCDSQVSGYFHMSTCGRKARKAPIYTYTVKYKKEYKRHHGFSRHCKFDFQDWAPTAFINISWEHAAPLETRLHTSSSCHFEGKARAVDEEWVTSINHSAPKMSGVEYSLAGHLELRRLIKRLSAAPLERNKRPDWMRLGV